MSAWAGALVLAFARPALASDDASTSAPAQPGPAVAADSSQKPRSWDWAMFPVLFYSPETSLGFAGGGAIFGNAPSPPGKPRRDDSATLGVQLTLRKQLAVTLNLTKYFDDARFQITEDAALAHVPNYYWGLGNDTPDSAQEAFTQSGVFSRVTLGMKVWEEVYVGAGFSAGWYDVTDAQMGGVTQGFLQSTPASGSLIGVGPIIRRDTRNDALGAHSGSISSFAATFYPGSLGTYAFSYYELDQRSHFELGSRTVLAVEGYGVYAPGHVPLIDMPALGGGSRLRGYFQGRYRDHLYVMGQFELRVHVAWRVSMAPFAGVGNVFPSISAVSLNDPKYSGGLSLRCALKKDRDLNAHLDVAWAPGSYAPAIYFNFGEAF